MKLRTTEKEFQDEKRYRSSDEKKKLGSKITTKSRLNSRRKMLLFRVKRFFSRFSQKTTSKTIEPNYYFTIIFILQISRLFSFSFFPKLLFNIYDF
jgi:hypothetical protein